MKINGISSDTLKKFQTSLFLHKEGLKKEANRVLLQQSRLLVKDFIYWTPPFGDENSTPKEQGKKAVVRDIVRTVHPVDVSKFDDKNMKKQLEKLKVSPNQQTFTEIVNNVPSFRNFKTLHSFTPELHTDNRYSQGLIDVPVDKQKVTFNYREWKEHARKIVDKVLELKASWLVAANKLQLPVGAAIKKHSVYAAKVGTCDIVVGDNPKVTITNGGKPKRFLKNAVSKSIRERTKAMVKAYVQGVKSMVKKG